TRRAATVATFLVSQGLNPNIVSAKGFGDTHPVASNDTPQGRAQNRRIEITIHELGVAERPTQAQAQDLLSPQDPRLINVLYATDRAINGPAVGEIEPK